VGTGSVAAVGVAGSGVSVEEGTVGVGGAATMTVGGVLAGAGVAVGSGVPLERGVLVGVGVGGACRARGK